ncbi:PQQ-binding-like beta-propeller repeat protein [Pelagibacterales bacterium SAG-MED28]|nr:PQQ-binding-like beta-propeller repeat protein [Pelagibacterales bacterium SAG-MED28]|tara:strand:+ start:2537 stop:3859 length:1323 start_codon:yes stop_codon:yes gene_type:complete
MKLFYFLITLIFLNNCSFDNKSGIWNNDNKLDEKDDKIFKEFKSISSTNEKFYQIVNLDKEFEFEKQNLIKNFEWKDIFYGKNNNLGNFKYNNNNQLIFKSKKLTKHKINEHILFDKNNIIASDIKGNLIIFSINKNKQISKFNFYQKKFKKIKKNLNLIIENNTVYISDNLGFIYAFDYLSNKVLWAKNYKIPFSSNIKISKNKLILANQNNTLFFINKKNGEILKSIPTEETTIKNNFMNNLAVDGDNVIFLNTYGSLYALNITNMQIKWFINLNESLNINPSNLFISNQLIIRDNRVYVPANSNLYVLDLSFGTNIYKKNFSSIVRPIVLTNVFYTIDNNLLIATEINSGKIVFSYDINQKISERLKIKKKKVQFKSVMLLNDKIFIFLKNSYIVKFKINGEIYEITKLPQKINSQPIIIDNSIIFLDKSNRVSIVD